MTVTLPSPTYAGARNIGFRSGSPDGAGAKPINKTFINTVPEILH